MALGVAAVSVAVGGFTVVKVLVPAVDAWTEGREIVFGATVVVAVVAAFVLGMRAARARPVVAQGAGD
jgi:high-affinity nickel-transport protein